MSMAGMATPGGRKAWTARTKRHGVTGERTQDGAGGSTEQHPSSMYTFCLSNLLCDPKPL